MNTPRPNALILTGFGINCDRETEHAFRIAGAEVASVHLNDLVVAPEMLNKHQIFVVPGGFSFGDDVASGRILANRLRYRLGPALKAFVDAGNLVMGICNGFQVLVKMGILPGSREEFAQTATLTHNDSDRFEDRWVHLLRDPNTPCVWLEGIESIELPVRHGEGKFMMAGDAALDALESAGLVALRYTGPDGAPADGEYPANPNGSQRDIAGICSPNGRVFGLMPHPEAYVEFTHHPSWTRREDRGEGAGLAIFRNGVAHAARQQLEASSAAS